MVYGYGLNTSAYMDYLYNNGLSTGGGYGYMPTMPMGINQPQAGGVIGLKPSKAQNGIEPKGVIPVDKYAADDGKISFGSKAKNFIKGIGKFFTGMFTDETGKFSLGRTLKTAAIAVGIGAACVLTAGTAVPALIAAGGVAASGIGLAKGAIRAASATTDAEAEAAWQSMGSSTTALGLSVVGARAVAKGAHAELADGGRYNGAKGLVNGVKDVFVDSGKAIGESASGLKTAWTTSYGFKGKLSAIKENVVEQGRAFDAKVKNNINESVRNVGKKINNETKSLEAKRARLDERRNNAKTKVEKDFLDKKINKLDKEITARNEIENANSYDSAMDVINSNNARITDLQTKVKNGSISVAEKSELSELIARRNIQNDILTRKTEATNVLEKEISAKQQKLEQLQKAENPDMAKINELKSQISDLESQVTFDTPRSLARKQVKAVEDARIAAEKRQAEYDRVNTQNEINKQKLAESNKKLDEANAELQKAEDAQEQVVIDLWNTKHALDEKIDIAELNMIKAKAEQLKAEAEAINDYNYNGFETHASYGNATLKAREFVNAEKQYNLAKEQFNSEVAARIEAAEEADALTTAQRNASNAAQNEVNNAQTELNNSQGELNNAFNENCRAKGHLDNETAWQDYYNNRVAANGADVVGNKYTQALNELTIDAKNTPSAYWLTAEYAGRKQWYPATSPIELTDEKIENIQPQYQQFQ